MDDLKHDLQDHFERIAVALIYGERSIFHDAKDDITLRVEEYQDDIAWALSRITESIKEDDPEWTYDALEEVHILLEGVQR